MAGVSYATTQPSGVTTTFATILTVTWQPAQFVSCVVGFYVDENAFNSGMPPVTTQYVPLDITQIVTTGNIPAQIISQLTSPSGICPGGVPVS